MIKRYLTALAGAAVSGGAAFAAEPVNGAIDLQPAATSIMEDVRWLHDWWLMPIITIITIIVLGLLLYVMVKYNAKANPVPKKFSHNTTVEVVWTVVPVLLLIAIAFPSFQLLYYKETIPQDVAEADIVNIKATGWRWYWTYDYAESADAAGDDFQIISNMMFDEDLGPNDRRNLSTDYPMVVPVDRVVRLYVAGADVIHSWAMPAFGIKIDAIPGRLNEVWFRVDEAGRYFGQCSEICGIRHAFMPIEIRALPQAQYDQWLETARDDLDAANALLDQFQPEFGGARMAALTTDAAEGSLVQ